MALRLHECILKNFSCLQNRTCRPLKLFCFTWKTTWSKKETKLLNKPMLKYVHFWENANSNLRLLKIFYQSLGFQAKFYDLWDAEQIYLIIYFITFFYLLLYGVSETSNNCLKRVVKFLSESENQLKVLWNFHPLRENRLREILSRIC